MKTKEIIAIALIILGMGSLLYFMNLPITGSSKGTLASTLDFFAISYPLIITGILLLFSTVGASMVIIGVIATILSINYSGGPLAFISIALVFIGIVYGLVEGIVKLVKFSKNKNN